MQKNGAVRWTAPLHCNTESVEGLVPAPSHEGEQHQQQAAETSENRDVAEGLEAEVIGWAADSFAGELLGNPGFFVALPLVAAFLDEFLLGHLARNNFV